jgi:NhaP-type Na+/H+ or K+/H+ antiporter
MLGEAVVQPQAASAGEDAGPGVPPPIPPLILPQTPRVEVQPDSGSSLIFKAGSVGCFVGLAFGLVGCVALISDSEAAGQSAGASEVVALVVPFLGAFAGMILGLILGLVVLLIRSITGSITRNPK